MNELIDLTKKLVAINSISTTKNNKSEYNENKVAEFIHKYFLKNSIDSLFISLKDGRKCVFGFKKGSSKKTIVLIAHHDTVGVEDYQAGDDPFDVEEMTKKNRDPKFLYGRGTGDMKAGIAVGMHLVKSLGIMDLKTNVIFVSVPDEENNSAGILAAVKHLSKLKKQRKLIYIGSINLDSLLEDPSKLNSKSVITGGTIGKLLPCFFVVGKSAHVSDPFAGISSDLISSEIIRELDGNPMYSNKNSVSDSVAPPPICLKATDLKYEYTVQLPLKSFLYFNYLTYTETPTQVIKKMKLVAQKSLSKALNKNGLAYKKYESMKGKTVGKRPWEKNAKVYSYKQIHDMAIQNNPNLPDDILKLYKSIIGLDVRESNLKIVDYVSKIAEIPEPYIVYFYSPPYYPSSYDNNSAFIASIKYTLAQFGKQNSINFLMEDFSDGISDMNYLQINKNTGNDLDSYINNNPIEDHNRDFDSESIKDISMPIVDIGPYGLNPHQNDEKVDIKYTFTQLPKLLLEVIMNLQAL